MKVKIGNYPKWWGPFQIAEAIMFWEKKRSDSVYNFGKWLGESKNGEDSKLTKLCQWVHEKRKRKVKIKIDEWDSWNADDTLALLILPVLKDLKATQCGSGYVKDADLPESLQKLTGDDSVHVKWSWVLDEMIWAFEQLQPECDWEAKYSTGAIDIDFVLVDNDKDYSRLVYGPNHTFIVHEESKAKHQARIDNGLLLFAKYYQNLWS